MANDDMTDCRCVICSGELTSEEYDQEIADNVREYGFHALGVIPDETTHRLERPHGFLYTVGLEHSLGHPELIVMNVPPKLAHGLMWQCVNSIKAHGELLPGPRSGILRNLDVWFLNAGRAARRDRLTFASSYHGGTDRFRARQLVWPDKRGRFPWQRGYRSHDPQILLGEPDRLLGDDDLDRIRDNRPER
jgi:hypothetical protein